MPHTSSPYQTLPLLTQSQSLIKDLNSIPLERGEGISLVKFLYKLITNLSLGSSGVQAKNLR